MALDGTALAGLIKAELQNAGFDVYNQHSQATVMCQAIGNAVVAHIKSNAQVVVAGGSSAGSYSVS